MRPPLDFSEPPKPREEPGVRLVLKCKVCGREREHIFPKVYYDLGTANDDKKKDKYDPLIIPQRVVCPKCGAVDQYELGTMGHMAVTASLLALRFPDDGNRLARGSTGAVPQLHDPLGADAPAGGDRTLSARAGPAARGCLAARRLRQSVPVPRPPRPGRIRVCAGSAPRSRCCRGLDRPGAARRSAPRYSGGDPLLGEGARNIPEERSIACGSNPLGESAEEALADLRQGIIPPSEPPLSAVPAAPKPSPGASSDTAQRKVGRNEPCPCGSGKKYKHCHGRKG